MLSALYFPFFPSGAALSLARITALGGFGRQCVGLDFIRLRLFEIHPTPVAAQGSLALLDLPQKQALYKRGPASAPDLARSRTELPLAGVAECGRGSVP